MSALARRLERLEQVQRTRRSALAGPTYDAVIAALGSEDRTLLGRIAAMEEASESDALLPPNDYALLTEAMARGFIACGRPVPEHVVSDIVARHRKMYTSAQHTYTRPDQVHTREQCWGEGAHPKGGESGETQ